MTMTEDYPPLALVDGSVEEEWPYPWVRDGLTYSYCIRCGIRMELPESQLWSANPREYCISCDTAEFRLKPYGWYGARNLHMAA